MGGRPDPMSHTTASPQRPPAIVVGRLHGRLSAAAKSAVYRDISFEIAELAPKTSW